MSHPFLQPKFLSKEERAKLALAKRDLEIREQREKDEKRKTERDALERDAEELRQKEFQASSSSKYSRCQCSYFPGSCPYCLQSRQTRTDTHIRSVTEAIAMADETAIRVVLRRQETVSKTCPLLLAPTAKSSPPLPRPLQKPLLLSRQ